jgi:hypothetical protein
MGNGQIDNGQMGNFHPEGFYPQTPSRGPGNCRLSVADFHPRRDNMMIAPGFYRGIDGSHENFPLPIEGKGLGDGVHCCRRAEFMDALNTEHVIFDVRFEIKNFI